MKRYNFRLDTVRRVRRTQETIAKSALLEANTEVQKATAVADERTRHYNESIGKPAKATSVESFMRQRQFNELAGMAVVAARASVSAAQAEASMKRAAFTEAARKTKALDRLDERTREEHELENERQAEKEVDDIITGRFIASLKVPSR